MSRISDFNLHSLINPQEYQVFLFSCPCSMPISFASHNWFLVNKKGEISRWEVAHKNYNHPAKWGFLYKDLNALEDGLEVIYGVKKWHWKPKLIGFTGGDEPSLAGKMADFILDSKETYPLKDIYHFFGPNSNTYIQWVLDNFPEFKARLPFNAIGKNHRLR